MILKFRATKFDEVFSGYQPGQESVLNRRFEDHLGHHQQQQQRQRQQRSNF
jgi:hypothetical protein